MALESETTKSIPWYQDVDDFRIPGSFPAEMHRSALKYKPRPDDLFIVTYPKCGTTWVQHIVGSIFREGKPFTSEADFMTQTPFLQLCGPEAAENMKRPSSIKVHLPFHLTPYSPEAKYIFVARNPKDCCVSFYHHTKNTPAYKFMDGSFDDFFELFLNGEVDFGDYFDTLLSWYERRNDPNVLFITYEELKKDTEATVLKIASFIDDKYKVTLESNPTVMADVIKHSSIEYMRKYLTKGRAELEVMPVDELLNHPDLPRGLCKYLAETSGMGSPHRPTCYVRNGIVGDWRNHFSAEQCAKLEAKFQERTAGTDIPKLWQDSM